LKGEADVVFKKVITAAAAVAMMAGSTTAVAQTAAPVAPASETVEGSELRGGFIIPLIALIAIILGLCTATDICGGDDEDLPHSP
jgi:hypothetical protein